MTIEETFNKISDSIFRINPPATYAELPALFIQLCEQIKEQPDTESLLSLGECGECDIASLIVGAYWHFTEWHAGQYSDSYAALCALGSIFQPGYTDGPEPESSEQYAYESLNQLAEESRS